MFGKSSVCDAFSAKGEFVCLFHARASFEGCASHMSLGDLCCVDLTVS